MLNIFDIVGTGQEMKAKRYIEYLPEEILIKNEEGVLTLKAEEFHNWISIPYKKSLWDKLTR